MTVRGTVVSDEGVLLPTKWRLTGGGTRSMTTQGVVAAAKRSKRSKTKRKEKKTRAKSMKKINLIDYVDIRLQSTMTYTYIGSRT
jgi:hypothetical protein